jgi:hypothetical protein
MTIGNFSALSSIAPVATSKRNARWAFFFESSLRVKAVGWRLVGHCAKRLHGGATPDQPLNPLACEPRGIAGQSVVRRYLHIPIGRDCRFAQIVASGLSARTLAPRQHKQAFVAQEWPSYTPPKESHVHGKQPSPTTKL